MVEEAIGLGLVISLLFSETLGLAAGGMVVPGYLALMIHEPFRISGTVATGLATLGIIRLLSRFMLIYGRRRIVVALLTGFAVGALSRDFLVIQAGSSMIDARTIGYVIPGLMANWMDRQGVVPTVCVMTTTAVLVRLLLMLISAGVLIR
jgi:poly-gamma-glutamate biosynthesis protein PgsC/CapC